LFREEKAAQAKNGLLTAIIIPFKNSDKKRCPVNIIFHQGKANSIQKTVNDEGEARQECRTNWNPHLSSGLLGLVPLEKCHLKNLGLFTS
jgi:hypothetical protein